MPRRLDLGELSVLRLVLVVVQNLPHAAFVPTRREVLLAHLVRAAARAGSIDEFRRAQQSPRTPRRRRRARAGEGPSAS